MNDLERLLEIKSLIEKDLILEVLNKLYSMSKGI